MQDCWNAFGGHAYMPGGVDLDKKYYIVRNSWGMNGEIKVISSTLDYVHSQKLVQNFHVLNLTQDS